MSIARIRILLWVDNGGPGTRVDRITTDYEEQRVGESSVQPSHGFDRKTVTRPSRLSVTD